MATSSWPTTALPSTLLTEPAGAVLLVREGVRGLVRRSSKAVWVWFEEAVQMLNFENDRTVLRKAFEVVQNNFETNGVRRV